MSEAVALLDKASIQQLPPFKNLNHHNIVVIENIEQCKSIEEELKTLQFWDLILSLNLHLKWVKSQLGHLIQLATAQKAYLFHVNSSTLKFLQPILSNQKQIKVGFGLKMINIFFIKRHRARKLCGPCQRI